MPEAVGRTAPTQLFARVGWGGCLPGDHLAEDRVLPAQALVTPPSLPSPPGVQGPYPKASRFWLTWDWQERTGHIPSGKDLFIPIAVGLLVPLPLVGRIEA